MLRSEIYFDNAATTPLHPEARAAMAEVFDLFGNPTSIHAEGRRSRVFIEECRARAADLLRLQPSELFFTSGGTESIQTVLTSAVRDMGIERIITTPLEHPAVLKNIEHLQKYFRFDTIYAPFDNLGRIDPDGLEPLLKDQPNTMVVLMHANNETGMLLPLNRIASLCFQNDVLFLADTVQTTGKLRLNLSDGVSFAAASAHKFHGPKGAGMLTAKGGSRIQPLILGGGQERNLRSGTENIIGIAGMVKALEVAIRDIDQTMPHIEFLRNRMVNGLVEIFPDLLIFTDLNHSLYSILNVGFPVKQPGEMLIYRLDIHGIAVSGGSACSSGANHPSHVLEALKSPPGYDHVRFSFSRFNTIDEVEKCLDTIRHLIEQ